MSKVTRFGSSSTNSQFMQPAPPPPPPPHIDASSINVTKTIIKSERTIASSFDSKCNIDPTSVQQAKKKRAAFDNISVNVGTALGGITSTNASAAAVISAGASKSSDVAKKSRFNVAISGLPLIKKTSEASSTATKKFLSSSKENLSTMLLPNATGKKASDAAVSAKKQQAPLATKFAMPKLTSFAAAPPAKVTRSRSKVTEVKKEASIQEKLPEMKSQPFIDQQHINILGSVSAPASASSFMERQMSIATSSDTAMDQETDSFSCCDSYQPMSVQSEPVPIEWEDIDKGEYDEFNVGDYVVDIFSYYREREARFKVKDYLRDQVQINRQMRSLLVDWMVEVQQQLEFNHEVLYLSVKLLDLFLSRRKMDKSQLQLLGGAAMFVACKFEERLPPIIEDFIYVSDNAYDRDAFVRMEIEVLKTVQFDIGAPLAYTFLRRYSKCVRADMRFLTLARYILELSLQEYTFAYESESHKACAALYLALKLAIKHESMVSESSTFMLKRAGSIHEANISVFTANLTDTEWNKTLSHYTDAELADFIQLVPAMNKLVKEAPSAKYRTVYKKYCHQVFYEVAKLSPLSDVEMEHLLAKCDSSK